MATLPYYSSLNSQMAEYYKQVKMQEYNDTYHQAQLDIVLDGQRNLATQAQIMEKLNELQSEIANQAIQNVIPLSKTNAPEMIIEKKKYSPMTTSDYENAVKKPTTFLQEVLKIKEKKPSTKISLQDILTKKENLKQTTMQEKKSKSKTPFQKELEEKINIRRKEKKPLVSGEETPTLLSPTSTSATYQQSSMGSPQEKKKGRTTLTGKTIPEIKNEFITKIKTPLTLGNYEIRIEKGKTIIKDINTNSDIQKPPAQLLHSLYNEFKISGNGIRKKKAVGSHRNNKGQFVKK